MADDGSDSSTMYYPSDMLKDFKNIKFTVDGSGVSIAINSYRNNDAGSHPSAGKGGTQDAIVIKDALLQLDHTSVLSRAGGAQAYVDVFTGKGAPEAIGKVLATLADYSDKFIGKYGKGGGPARTCADWLADPSLSWNDTLQKISDEFLGLDCNGFVGNWLKRCDHALKLGPQNGPRDVYNARKLTRTKVEQIAYCDVVVWANFSHIAALDDVAGTGLPKINMCQSAGGGPRINEYSIAISSPGKFRLAGGIPASDVGGEVYVISPWAE